MINKILKYSITLSLILATGGCKKYVEKGDVNINPNAASTTTLKSLLPALIDATATNHYADAFYTTLFAQQMAAYTSGFINIDQNIDVRLDIMQGLYQNAMTNAKIMIDLANTQNANYYSAIGRILLVDNLMMATDVYGDVPYSNAFKAPDVLYPSYDKQEDLYPLMQKLLDSAITGATTATQGIIPAADDLSYKGVMASWVQTANLLKARLYMHTTKKGAVAAANNALAALTNSYTSNATDFQLIYNSRNKNPWAANVSLRVATGNFFLTPSLRFVNTMNGSAYPGLVDPRLPFLMDKKANANYTGLANGGGNTGNTVDITTNTFYATETSLLVMAGFSERKFIEAEAAFLANGGNATSVGSTQMAYDAYLAGITANMKKVGVADSNITNYIINPFVAVTPAGLTMNNIMHEKQIVLFMNAEAWNDVRRYDYNPAVFAGMALPLNQWPSMGGNFIRRSGLPNDELGRNPNAGAANKLTTDKVWWDQ
ncbi:MAG: SusD/RagB family nutrient-binding outer membrane lipoprotein [Ferruginibacter sp.]